MRTKLIALILFTAVLSGCDKNGNDSMDGQCNCFIETASDTYKYPIRPGSDTWKTFTNSDQMLSATQIPASTLGTISTAGLVESCLEWPLGSDYLLANIPQEFYDYAKKENNAYRELAKRDDVATELIKKYLQMCTSCGENNNYSNSWGKGGDASSAFASIELILAQKDILSKATKEQKRKLAAALLRNYENNVGKGLRTMFYHYPMWVASRMMDLDKYTEFQEFMANDDIVSGFVSSGQSFLPNDNRLKSIVKHFKSFINTKI